MWINKNLRKIWIQFIEFAFSLIMKKIRVDEILEFHNIEMLPNSFYIILTFPITARLFFNHRGLHVASDKFFYVGIDWSKFKLLAKGFILPWKLKVPFGSAHCVPREVIELHVKTEPLSCNLDVLVAIIFRIICPLLYVRLLLMLYIIRTCLLIQNANL